MKHPDEEYNIYQAAFLAKCDPDSKRFHELMFKVGNATVSYHRKAKEFGPIEKDWEEWIDGLEEPMKTSHRKEGFEACKRILNFTRYVMEKNDMGLQAFLEANLDKSDLEEYQNLIE